MRLRLLIALAFLATVVPSLALGGQKSAAPGADTCAAADNQREIINFLLKSGQEALSQERYAEAQARFTQALDMDWNQPRAFDLLQKARTEQARALADWESQARVAQAGHDWVTALQLMRRVLAEDSARPGASDMVRRLIRRKEAGDLVRRGLEKYIIEDYAGAQTDFDRALAIDPGDSMAANYRDRAVRNVEHAGSLAELRADSTAWAQYLSALQKFRAGDLTGAERLWNEILARFPGNDNVRSNLEQVRRRLRQDGMATAE